MARIPAASTTPADRCSRRNSGMLIQLLGQQIPGLSMDSGGFNPCPSLPDLYLSRIIYYRRPVLTYVPRYIGPTIATAASISTVTPGDGTAISR